MEQDLAFTVPSTADAQAIISVKDRVAKLEAQVTNIQEEQKGIKMEVTGMRQENKSNVADILAAMAAMSEKLVSNGGSAASSSSSPQRKQPRHNGNGS